MSSGSFKGSGETTAAKQSDKTEMGQTVHMQAKIYETEITDRQWFFYQ